MCGAFLGSPSSALPAPPPPPPRVATTRQPRLADEGVRKAQEDTQSRARQFGARGGTLITGAGGLQTQASGQKKTLLGA